MRGLKSVEIVAVVTGGWVFLELVHRWIVVPAAFAIDPTRTEPLLTTALDSVGVPVIAVILTAYALARGRDRNAWDWNWDPQQLGAGALVAVALLLFVTVARSNAVPFGGSETASVPQAALEITPWVAVLFVLVYGIAAPIAEEQVWRAIVQTELVDGLGAVAGIAVTALLVTVTSVIVNLSVAGVGTALAFGVLFGVVRHRWGTASSTVAHVLYNTAAAASILAIGLG